MHGAAASAAGHPSTVTARQPCFQANIMVLSEVQREHATPSDKEQGFCTVALPNFSGASPAAAARG